MNLQTTTAGLDADDRQQLVDSVRRFAERDYFFEARMRALRQDGGFSPEHWRTFAGLGWLGIGLPDGCGGIGGAIEQTLLAEELGRCLVVEPWLPNCALTGPLLSPPSWLRSSVLCCSVWRSGWDTPGRTCGLATCASGRRCCIHWYSSMA